MNIKTKSSIFIYMYFSLVGLEWSTFTRYIIILLYIMFMEKVLFSVTQYTCI